RDLKRSETPTSAPRSLPKALQGSELQATVESQLLSFGSFVETQIDQGKTATSEFFTGYSITVCSCLDMALGAYEEAAARSQRDTQSKRLHCHALKYSSVPCCLMPRCAMGSACLQPVQLGVAFLTLAALAEAAAAPEECEDTPGWTNGYTACNNYVPVDPDCHEDGVVCHFYKEHADFCAKGMNDPWLNCCTCGGGSTFNGERPTTTPRPTVDIPGLSWLPGIHSVEKQISKMEEQMKPFEQGMHEVYQGLNAPDFNAPPELEGNSLVQVNWAVFLIIVVVAGGTAVGWCCDLVAPACSIDELRREAQRRLGVGRGKLLSPSGRYFPDGDITVAQAELSHGDLLSLHREPLRLASTVHAFAAILGDGTVVTWGHDAHGGSSTAVRPELKNVKQVQATGSAFAALLADGSVLAWGNPECGGDCSSVQERLVNVKRIEAGFHAFVAILDTGSVVTWGDAAFGGQCSEVYEQLQGVQQVSCTGYAFAAILDNGSVVTWGHPAHGGDSRAAQHLLKNVQQIKGTMSSFAAVLDDGSVIQWGPPAYGAKAVQVPVENVQRLEAGFHEFVAILQDASLVTWGHDPWADGITVLPFKNVQHVQVTDTAFAALLTDGTVASWGDADSGGDSDAVQEQLHDVRCLESSGGAFAALLEDGAVVTWGDRQRGGNSSSVQAQLKNTRAIYANGYAFAAIVQNGPVESVVTWGNAFYGGDSTYVQVGLGPKPPSLDEGLPGASAYHSASGGRPPVWSTIMLILSYVLLVPGLTQVLFSFNIVVNVLGHRIDVQPEKGHVACTETVTGLVHLLEKTGSRTGAVLIVLYAVVVPVVKLLLLAIGEVFRFSSSEFLVLVARLCILIVQSISKWACPDMFAYILLVHLVRLLHSDPLVLTAAKLDVGFSCFSVFCVCSTVSSLGISLPLLPTKTAVTGKPFCSAKAVQLLAGVIAAVFAIFFIAGLSIPCMSLRIDERQLYPPNGSVPYSAKPLVESLAIPDLLKSDISILSCTRWLIQEIGSGEANSLFALVMFGFCVIALPLADVLFLLLAASRLEPTAAGKSLPPSDQPCWFYSWAKVLRKLAMLDVSIMGVYVITFCMGIYKKQGIVLSTHNGVLLLIVAEVAHTLLYWLVSGAAEHAEASARKELIAYRAAAQEAGDPDADGPQDLSCCGLSKFLKLPVAMGAGPGPDERYKRAEIKVAGFVLVLVEAMAPPRVVLADLPPAERERMLSFLVANKVDFKPDISGKFSAVVKVVRPEATSPAASPSLGADKAADQINMAGWVPSASSTPSTSARTEETPGAGKGTSLTAVQSELKKRFPTFTGLLPALGQHPKTMTKAELLSFIEEVYTARYNQDLLQIQQHAEAEAVGVQIKKKLPSDLTSFPQSVVTVAGKRYGLRRMVGQVCWSVAKSVELHRAEHEGIETFARFLEESYDAIDALFYLEMRWAARQMTIPRGTWLRAWKMNQGFTPGHHFLAGAARPRTVDGQVSKTSVPPGARPQLALKKALAAVREGIDKEAPDSLKATICARVKQESGDGANPIDWDRFLFLCTQEYRKARCIASQRKERRGNQGILTAFSQLVSNTWGVSLQEAFAHFDVEGSGVISFDNFAQVVANDLAYEGAAKDLWDILDVQSKGYLEEEEWSQLGTSEQVEGSAPTEDKSLPSGWDADLGPEESQALLQEAREVAARLTNSLAERGAGEADPDEVFGWALRVVLKRHGQPCLAKFHEGRDHQAVEGEDEQRDLEAIVRKQLSLSTEELVWEALAEATGGGKDSELTSLAEVLVNEFLLVTDALMEALVSGNIENWLTTLGIEAPGTESQKEQFQALTDELQGVLATQEEGNEDSVAHVCRLTVAAPELRELCAARTTELLQDQASHRLLSTSRSPDEAQPETALETGVGVSDDTPETPNFAQVEDTVTVEELPEAQLDEEVDGAIPAAEAPFSGEEPLAEQADEAEVPGPFGAEAAEAAEAEPGSLEDLEDAF
ncbi:HERC2, partial [Symbiodinium sp. KB8]